MGTTTDIRSGFFTEIENAGFASVAYPNIVHDGVFPFVEVHIMPASTNSVGLSGINRLPGILQVDCNVASGGGEISAATLADQVIDLFRRGTRIKSGSTTIEINEKGWANPGQQTPDGYFIPVTIPYEVLI